MLPDRVSDTGFQYVREVQSKKNKLINLLLSSDQSKEATATKSEAQVSTQWKARELGTTAYAKSQALRRFLS